MVCPPTATTSELLAATPRRPSAIPLVTGVQLTPSALVSTVPAWPTTMIVAPFTVTARSRAEVPDTRLVHVAPSGLVRIVPFWPTATIWD